MRFRRLIKKLILFSLILVFLGTSSAFAAILSVPQKYQEKSYWCWAACSQAILEYYGTYVTQTQIANYAVGGANKGYPLCTDSRTGIDGVLYHFDSILSTCWQGYYLSKSKVQQEIDAGRPIQIAIDWRAGGGHAVVIQGIAGDFLRKMDPSSGPVIETYDYTVSNSSYSWQGTLKLDSTLGSTPGGNDYCRDYGPCSEGQGDCDPGQCQSGLTCVNDVGPKYGWSSATDVCEKSTTSGTPGDYDYCTLYGPCSAGQGDCDSNAECQSGLSCVDDVGAKYGYDAIVDVCEASTSGNPGDDDYCRDYGPCSEGQGDCDSNAECQSGLTCVNDVGAKYGWKSVTDVCEKSTGVGNLKAYVTNWNATTLVSGATVTVEGKSGTTGSGGYVTITGIAAGTRTVTVSYGRYYDYFSVDIVSGTTVSYYFPLSWVY